MANPEKRALAAVVMKATALRLWSDPDVSKNMKEHLKIARETLRGDQEAVTKQREAASRTMRSLHEDPSFRAGHSARMVARHERRRDDKRRDDFMLRMEQEAAEADYDSGHS